MSCKGIGSALLLCHGGSRFGLQLENWAAGCYNHSNCTVAVDIDGYCTEGQYGLCGLAVELMLLAPESYPRCPNWLGATMF